MFLRPYTTRFPLQVNRFVFVIDNEYRYPAIKNFDDCEILGLGDFALKNPDGCYLRRENRETRVTMQP